MGHPALIGTVFEGLTRDALRTDPFPHAVIDTALPPDTYRRLAATLPEVRANGANRRVALPGWMLATADHIDASWHAFARRHLVADIVPALAEVFAEHWAQPLPPPEDLRGRRLGWVGADVMPDLSGRPSTQAEADLLVDCRLESISPSPDRPGSHRRQHLDLACRYFSALFYMRSEADGTAGGGLTLFRWRGPSPAGAFDAFELDDSLVEPAATIPYAANRLVVFPNGPDALHGAEERAATSHPRQYVFLTAEGRRDLW